MPIRESYYGPLRQSALTISMRRFSINVSGTGGGGVQTLVMSQALADDLRRGKHANTGVTIREDISYSAVGDSHAVNNNKILGGECNGLYMLSPKDNSIIFVN